MANWWDIFTSSGNNGMASVQGMPLKGSVPATMANAYGSYRAPATSMANARGAYQAPAQSTSGMYVAPSKSPTLATSSGPFNAGGPDRFERAPSVPAGPTPEEQAMAWIQQMLGQAYPGGGGPNLSGYDTMLGDISSRETALGGRRAEQEAYIAGIIEAARTRGTDAQGRIQGRYEEMGQTAADQRAGEINSIQNSELQRLAQRNAAREALGVAGGADIASAEAESAGAGITARGDAATRDAQIQQSIESQQYANQIAGLDPMQAQYGMALNSAYEDRLAQLASERAQIQAQVAQAKAAPRGGGGGLSISDYSQAYGLYNDMFGAGPGPDVSGTGLQVVQQYAQADPRNAELYGRILKDLPGVMSQYGLGIGGKNMDPTELANAIIAVRPDYGDAYLFIRDLVGSGN